MIKELKKLARSYKWINIYRLSKEHNGINLFKNSDLSEIQLIFLNWLNNYNEIITDIAMKETNLQIEDLDDDLRIEAYLYWKSKQRDKIKKDQEKQKNKLRG